ncbi:hypothetical protein V6N13_134075 [Hibiscus sabdariffa]|uniref:Uncharacterized protein n=2 Tax=Hibiscus sabdariffa TaxID=183260 RepID=A0ABR2QZI5_9ROSI
MSGGTPVAGGSTRQRHSQGYASDNEDLEDDACSRLQPFSPATPRARTWTEILKNVLWVASALFIIHFDGRMMDGSEANVASSSICSITSATSTDSYDEEKRGNNVIYLA